MQDDLDDAEFLRLALAGRLERFGHLDHLRLAYVAVEVTDGTPEAVVPLCRTAIRRMAEAAGEPDKFHETITVAWATILARYVKEAPRRSFRELVAQEPRLTDRELLLAHFSRERLFSDAARATWVEPDLAPLAPTSRQ